MRDKIKSTLCTIYGLPYRLDTKGCPRILPKRPLECSVHVADDNHLPSLQHLSIWNGRAWLSPLHHKKIGNCVAALCNPAVHLAPCASQIRQATSLRFWRSTLILCWHQRVGYFPRVLFVHIRYPPCLVTAVGTWVTIMVVKIPRSQPAPHHAVADTSPQHRWPVCTQRTTRGATNCRATAHTCSWAT